MLCFLKVSAYLIANNQSFHMHFSKVKFNDHLSRAKSAKIGGLFLKLQIMLKSPSKAKLVKTLGKSNFVAV